MADSLILPGVAHGALTTTYNSASSDDSKFPVYTLRSSGLSIEDAGAICEDMTLEYVRDTLGDTEIEDYNRFLAPVERLFSTPQECLEHHFECVDDAVLRGFDDREIEPYPYGFLVLDTRDRKHEGILLVHVDKICKKWYVGSIRLSASELSAELNSLRFQDVYFGDICKNHDVRVPQNDPDINNHYEDLGRDESGGWRRNGPMFAVFSTGMQGALPVQDMLDDDYDDLPFGHARVDLFAPTGSGYQSGWEEVKAYFPVLVGDDVAERRRHMGEGPCAKCRPLHPRLFVCVDKPEPRKDGVLICDMDWDGSVEGRSEDELRCVGEQATVTTKRVGVSFALSIIQAMAAEEMEEKYVSKEK